MIAAKCEKCGTIGNCFCDKAICKNVTKGTCCGDWDENGICKLTIPPKSMQEFTLEKCLEPYNKLEALIELKKNEITKMFSRKPSEEELAKFLKTIIKEKAPFDEKVGKPLATLQPCQGHDKETEKEENTATKFDTGKPKLSYVPQLALWEVGKSFSYGAAKYAEFNYSKGMEYTRLTDAALRHINQALRGEDIDEESQCYHISNAIASLMMLLDNQVNNTIIDNRNKNYKK